MVYHPFQRIDGGSSLPQEVRDKLFQTSVENVEYSLLLENEDRTKKWGWLFRTYVRMAFSVPSKSLPLRRIGTMARHRVPTVRIMRQDRREKC